MLNKSFFKFPFYNPMQQINKSVDFFLPKCSLSFYDQYQHRPSLPRLFQLLVSYSSLSTFKHLYNGLYLSIVANTGLEMKMRQTFYLRGGRDTNGWKTPSLNMTMRIIIANIGSHKWQRGERLGLFQEVEFWAKFCSVLRIWLWEQSRGKKVSWKEGKWYDVFGLE